MTIDLELFFDPVCPFCWVTSRWIEEVRQHRPLAVRYRPISLRMLNPGKPLEEPMGALHQHGLELLRVVQAVADASGDEAVGPLYTALGTAIHEHPAGDAEDFEAVAAQQVRRPDDLPGLLSALGLRVELAAASTDESLDVAIRASTDTALERAGGDVGTPVLTFSPPEGPSFFGPVLSEIPRGDHAVALFDATRTLAEHRPFTELKRPLRELPDVPALAALR